MQATNVLKQADIFYDLTPTQLELVASICEERRCRAGESVFEENSPSTDMYVIAKGEIEIQLDPALVDDGREPAPKARPVTIATLRVGQVFGEVALVDQGLRSATARASTHDTQLIVIPRSKLMTLCDSYPQLGYRLMRNLAADLALKIRNTDLEIRAQLLWKPRARTL